MSEVREIEVVWLTAHVNEIRAPKTDAHRMAEHQWIARHPISANDILASRFCVDNGELAARYRQLLRESDCRTIAVRGATRDRARR